MKGEILIAALKHIAKPVLILGLIIGSFLYGGYKFGLNLKKDMESKKELDSLNKEKLRLEIQIKRLELSKSNP